MPPLTAHGKERDAALDVKSNAAAGPEDLTTWDRCLLGFNAGPPIIGGGYNANVQLFQTADYVVLVTEMVHDARIIPLDGRAAALAHPPVEGRFARPLGRRHAGHRVEKFSGRRNRHLEPAPRRARVQHRRKPAPDRADPPRQCRHAVVRIHHRRPDRLDPAMDGVDDHAEERRADVRYACHEGNYGMAGICPARARRKKRMATERPNPSRSGSTRRRELPADSDTADLPPRAAAFALVPKRGDWRGDDFEGHTRCDLVLGCRSVLFLPRPVSAQATASGIAGVVRDTSGAVLPGVTVEAASPALIEKVRTVVTDGEGRYNIVDLRPGTYSVTFTLPGFNTVRREGIELTTGFTATVNADMQVGALEETITVTGAAPLVDTQNVRQQNVVSSELLDSLPSAGKGIAGLVKLVPGMTGGSDSGGASGIYSANTAARRPSMARAASRCRTTACRRTTWRAPAT